MLTLKIITVSLLGLKVFIGWLAMFADLMENNLVELRLGIIDILAIITILII